MRCERARCVSSLRCNSYTLQGETYKMALWKGAGSASPVEVVDCMNCMKRHARLFCEMGTNVTEDEHCLKLGSLKACLRGRTGWQVCSQPCRKTEQKVVVIQALYEQSVAVEVSVGKGSGC